MTAVDLTIVVPCYNEARRLPRCLAEVRRFLAGTGGTSEVIVVDDGSTDGTVAVAERERASFPQLSVVVLPANQGKGAAVRAGVLASRGARVAFTDADLSVSIDDLVGLIDELKGFDIAIASRALAESRVVAGQGPLRELAAHTFDIVRRILVIHGVHDTQCGMKAFRGDIARRLFAELSTASQLFDIEILLLAARGGLTVAEIPVQWTHDPDSRIRYGPLRSLRTFGELLRIRRQYHVRLPLRLRATLRLAGGGDATVRLLAREADGEGRS